MQKIYLDVAKNQKLILLFFRIPELMATKTILKRSRNKSDSPFKQSDTGVPLSPPKNTVKLTFNAPAEELTDEDKEQVFFC